MFTTTPYSELGIQPPPETLEHAPNNTHGIRFTGSGHYYFGAGLGFKFETAYGTSNPGLDFAAAGYTGIRFWVYSPFLTDYIVKLQGCVLYAGSGFVCAAWTISPMSRSGELR